MVTVKHMESGWTRWHLDECPFCKSHNLKLTKTEKALSFAKKYADQESGERALTWKN